MSWSVTLSKNAEKQIVKLSKPLRQTLYALIYDIETKGAVRGDWHNYGKLTNGKHHCHLKKGRPTYIAIWIEDKENINVEVVYVGTHEKAPY